MIIKRNELLDKVIKGMKSPLIKVIIGPRRSGKSYLLFKLFNNYLESIGVEKKNIIKIKFDELEFAGLRNPIELSNYINNLIKDDGTKYYILLDEIQECVKIKNPVCWEETKSDKLGKLKDGIDIDKAYITYHDVLNSLLNKKYVDCYVTGSNSRLLSTDLPTEFRNRSYNIEVFPLSFKELKDNFPEKDNYELWDEYITYGGMPLVVLDDDNSSKEKYLNDLFEGTYFRDIKERYNLHSDSNIDIVTDIVASCIGSPLNPNKIENTFKSNNNKTITDNTIANYLNYLENSFLLKEAKRYDVKGRKYINTLKKYYFIDNGLRNARLNFRKIEESHLMENVIYIELLRNGYSVDVGLVVKWNINKDTNKNERKNLEVDFIVNDGNKKYYIQSALEISNIEKQEQESLSLMSINDQFKKIIIIKNYKKPYYNEDGILIIGLFNFLMDAKIIER